MKKPPVVLLAAAHDHPLVGLLDVSFSVAQVPSAALAFEQAPAHDPDVVILAETLPDMSGFDACRTLYGERRVSFSVPCLVATKGRPTPDQRVAAVRAGVWDFVRSTDDRDEVVLRLEAFVQAKRNLDMALADGMTDVRNGLHTRNGLVRRARQLGALMTRERSGMACVVFSIDADALDPDVGGRVAKAARLSDVVGALSEHEVAVLAPGTDQEGVLRLAKRVALTLRDGGKRTAVSVLSAGYDAVANLSYTPVDPIELIQRAAMALHSGAPERELTWLRRYEPRLVINPVR